MIDHGSLIASDRRQQFDVSAIGRDEGFPQRCRVPQCCVCLDAPIGRYVVERVAEQRTWMNR